MHCGPSALSNGRETDQAAPDLETANDDAAILLHRWAVTTLFRLVHGLRLVNLDAEIDPVAAHLRLS